MRNCQLNKNQRAMTLVELLVVMTIMVLLLAVSVPILRPVFETQKTHNAAQTLLGTFRYARAKAMETGESYGVKLIPFNNEAGDSTVVVEMRLQKQTVTRYRNPDNIRIRVENGEIEFWFFDKDEPVPTWKPVVGNTLSAELQREYRRARDHFEECASSSGELAFETGTSFGVGWNGDVFYLLDYYLLVDERARERFRFPLERFPDPSDEPTKYVISIPGTGAFALAWLPPTVMPFGMVVDLYYSGGETVDFWGKEKEGEDAVPPSFFPGDEVVVSFSPAGHVDYLYINGTPIKVNEMLYFCVGEWDRQVDSEGNSLAEDGKSNLDMPATYWVTLHPKTGTARIAENAPIRPGHFDPEKDIFLERLREARRFASEHFFDIGER